MVPNAQLVAPAPRQTLTKGKKSEIRGAATGSESEGGGVHDPPAPPPPGFSGSIKHPSLPARPALSTRVDAGLSPTPGCHPRGLQLLSRHILAPGSHSGPLHTLMTGPSP